MHSNINVEASQTGLQISRTICKLLLTEAVLYGYSGDPVAVSKLIPSKEWIDLVKQLDAALANEHDPINPFARDIRNSPNPGELVYCLRQGLRFAWKAQSDLPPPPVPNEFFSRVRRPGGLFQENHHFGSAKTIVHRLFNKIGMPVWSSLPGRHGPGATADGKTRLSQKMSFVFVPRKAIEAIGLDCFRLNENHLAAEPFQRTTKHSIAKAVCVPKDVRGPRIICEEPSGMQFAQQLVKSYLQPRLDGKLGMHFASQEEHRSLLRQPGYSSLDLQDASDHVSVSLVRGLFPEPWLSLLMSLRSPFITDGEHIHGNRAYAPMGSALCFPIESVVHSALVASVIHDVPRKIVSVLPVGWNKWSVYGDDIIVHESIAGSVYARLVEWGLRPSPTKCFIHTAFRESCGLDIYLNVDVTPVYYRGSLSKVDPKGIHSLCLAQNALRNRGYLGPANYLERIISGVPRAPFPLPGVHLLTDDTMVRVRTRRHDRAVREYRALIPRGVGVRDFVSDWQAAFASLGCRYDLSENQVRANATHYTWRWRSLEDHTSPETKIQKCITRLAERQTK